MKKLLLLLFFFLLPWTQHGQKGWSVGIDLTLQHTGFTSWTNYHPFQQLAIRPTIGVSAGYHFKEWVGVRSGLRMHFYTQKREQFSNNFSYVSLPLHFHFNVPVPPGNTGLVKKMSPAGYLGFNTLLLTKATHSSSEGKQRMEKYTGRLHYELEGGLGVKILLRDDLLIENFVITAFGDPVNPKEYNSHQGAVVNMNLGLRTSLLYWLDASYK